MQNANPVLDTLQEIIRRAAAPGTSAADLVRMRQDVARIGFAIPTLSQYGKVSMRTDADMSAAVITAQDRISDAVKRHRETIGSLIDQHAPGMSLAAVIGREESMQALADRIESLEWMRRNGPPLAIHIDERIAEPLGTHLPEIVQWNGKARLQANDWQWSIDEVVAVNRDVHAYEGLIMMLADETIVRIGRAVADGGSR